MLGWLRSPRGMPRAAQNAGVSPNRELKPAALPGSHPARFHFPSSFHTPQSSQVKCEVAPSLVSSELTAWLMSLHGASAAPMSLSAFADAHRKPGAASELTEEHHDVSVSDPSVLSKQIGFLGTSARTSRRNGEKWKADRLRSSWVGTPSQLKAEDSSSRAQSPVSPASRLR